jgi:L,D-peptidoglycan transpeptidase YkuD (ErfK/YbiS/YcfS/YnhG family)
MTILLKNKQTLQIEDFIFKCSVGKNGLSKLKKEGDLKTPKGIFGLGDLYFRNDRIKQPLTKLTSIKIKKNMGWCDEPNNKKYNQLIQTYKKISHEKLFRKDSKYDLLVPIKYNSNKIIPGIGSCIFLHLTKDYKPTRGCIAIKKKDFIIMLKLINKNTKIKIL